MEISQTPASIAVQVIPASIDQEPILANLLELYVYDFSEFLDLHLDANGRFGYTQLPFYWREPNRYPFLIKVNEHWAGFALVRQGSQLSDDEQVWDMAEFFIIRGYRRHGIGRQAAAAVWQKFPGTWEVRGMRRNLKAKDFWSQAIQEFVGQAIESTAYDKSGKAGYVFSFESTGAA